VKIYVVGIGPGGAAEITPRAGQALTASDLIVGYQAYIKLIAPLFPQKQFIGSGMRDETGRCRLVLAKALTGATVSLISSGDSGIYGMAGIMLEVMNQSGQTVPVEIIPGITAISAAAAILGAPLMHDFAAISLSDLLTPWAKIVKRIECAAQGDFVLGFYNPKSPKRTAQIAAACQILLQYRDQETPVGIVRNAGRTGERHGLTTLGKLPEAELDMATMVIVGNSQTYVAGGKLITPRGYPLDREVTAPVREDRP
jgi:precorrin-3B C17-methyltransferase